MPNVRMPDGTLIKNVPEGTTKQQLMAKLGMAPSPQETPSFGQVAARTGTESLWDNITGTANTLINPLIPDAFRGNQNPMGLKTLEQAQSVYGDPAPAMNLTGADVMGAGQRLGEGAAALTSGDFSQFLPGSASENQSAITAGMREQRPGAALAGDVAGDAAFMMGVRPMTTGAANAAANKASAGIASWASGPSGVKNLLGTGAQKFIETNLPRGVGRLTDVGIQGAVLAHLNDQDPVKAGAFAAGAQGAGSLVLATAKPIVFSKYGLLASVAGATIALNMFGLPGVQDMSFGDTFKAASAKVIPTLIGGTALALAGFDRLPPSVRQNLPKLTDALTSLQTGAIAGVTQELLEEKESGDNKIYQMMKKFQSDPEYFGTTAMRRIGTAIESEDVSLGEVFDSLMDTRQFREKFNELEASQ